jgi:hypothetical protein
MFLTSLLIEQAILRQRGQNAVKLDLDIFYRIWNYKRLTT